MADARLERLLGGQVLAPLRQRLRRHFERGGTAEAVLQLGELSPAEHEALAQLCGRPARPTRSLRLDLAPLQARLQAAGIAPTLRDALTQLDGPIADITGERAASLAAWSALGQRPGRDARLQAWLQTRAASTLLKRQARSDAAAAEALLAQADGVLRWLPAIGLPRAQLAARTLGDAHALDAGRPVAALVLAAWRHAEAARGERPDHPGPATEEEEEEAPIDVADVAQGVAARAHALSIVEERVRDIWARAGVLVNELARPALVLNLPAPAGLAAVPWLPGEPAHLTLRWLLRTSPSWGTAGVTVFICENPNLLAIAADRLGLRCAPLVCTEGMPAAAQRTLLGQLAQSGARLRYHGDFDWPGVRIANQVLRSFDAAPWRMAAADYEAAADASAAARHPLSGRSVEAAWDPRLAAAMQRQGLAIAEESVSEGLIEDLGRG